MGLEGKTIDNRFVIIESLDSGGSASVYKAYDNNNDKPVAFKIYSSDKYPDEVLQNFWSCEVHALKKLNHKNIVKCIDAGRDGDTGYYYAAIEYVSGEDLGKRLTKVGRLDWQTWYSQYGVFILDALCHCYENNVLHRDISPKNIMIPESGNLKIIDFGVAKHEKRANDEHTVRGNKTPIYSPQETDDGTYTSSRDPYGFSAITMQALSGIKFETETDLIDATTMVKNS